MILPVLSFRIPGGKAASALLLPEAPPAPDERADIVPSLLTSGSSSTDGASVATASVAPGANRAVYAAVESAAGAGAALPTATGNGLTWVEVATVAFASGSRRLTVFRAMGASPSAGAITFDFGGASQTSFVWSVIEFDEVNTGGTNGSGATVQSVTDSAAGGTTLSATLAALENVKNVALVFVGTNTNATVTPDADFVEQSDNAVANGSCTLECETAVNQTACAATFATADAGIVAIEVKAGPA